METNIPTDEHPKTARYSGSERIGIMEEEGKKQNSNVEHEGVEDKSIVPKRFESPVDSKDNNIRTKYVQQLVKALVEITTVLAPPLRFWPLDFLPGRREKKKKTVEKEMIATVKELSSSGIDPQLFDSLLANEIDRRLKVRFGITFLVLTFLFTIISYLIVILDGIFQWQISKVAISCLIIETPIQFVGLLYIIARNLFPQPSLGKAEQRR